MASCRIQKAKVVEEAPAPNPVVKKSDEPAARPPALPVTPVVAAADDGMRMPDLLALPSDGEFKAASPGGPPRSPSSGTVTSRPPTEPPLRVKPPESQDPH